MFWKIFGYSLLALGSLLMFVAQIPPDEAISNLGRWFEKISNASAPNWLASEAADIWGMRLGGLFLLVGFFLWAYLRGKKKQNQPETTMLNSDSLNMLEQIHAHGILLLNRNDKSMTWFTNVQKWDEKAIEIINEICPASEARKFRMEILTYNLEISPDTIRTNSMGFNTEPTKQGLQKKLSLLKDIINSHVTR